MYYTKHLFWMRIIGCVGMFLFLLTCNNITTIYAAPTDAYEKIIFVGDSRTVQMSAAIQSANVKYIAKGSQGLEWFQKEAIYDLKAMVNNSKSQAVIFNLGVNDIKTGCNIDQVIYDYISYFNGLLPYLKDNNCDVYYMSINPFDRNLMAAYGKADRKYEDLDALNTALRTQLDPSIEYIDGYHYLVQTGWKTYDGLHYRASTYIKLHNFCLDAISKNKPVNTTVQWQYSSANKAWYLVDANGKKIRSQWYKYNGSWYYLGEDGTMVKDAFIKMNGKTYYFRESGKQTRVRNEWRVYHNKWYYFDANCAVVKKTGFQRIENQWHYIRSDTNEMRKDQWADLGQNRYHFDENGNLSSRWSVIEGETYYFLKSTANRHNGQMQRNKWYKAGNHMYYVGPEGKVLKNQWIEDRWVDEYGRWQKNIDHVIL